MSASYNKINYTNALAQLPVCKPPYTSMSIHRSDNTQATCDVDTKVDADLNLNKGE